MEKRTDRSGGPDACWPFIGCALRGYGQIRTGSKTDGTSKSELAHRVAWQVANGPIPEGLFVCHRCDNPPCCNPSHLFLGTPADNAQDMGAKGRASATRHPPAGEKNGQSRLSVDAVRDIRSRYAAGGVTQRNLARQHGVSQARIQKIVTGEGWRHVE